MPGIRILQALELGDVLDRLAEPAGHLDAGVVEREGHEAEGLVDLVPELEPAAVIEPGHVAHETHAEGHRCEILRGEGVARPEVAVRGIHLDHALLDGIEALERRDELAGREVRDVQPVAGHDADLLDDVGRAAGSLGIEGRSRPVGVGHAPGERLLGPHHEKGRFRTICWSGKQLVLALLTN
jgi:hypothetical protein